MSDEGPYANLEQDETVMEQLKRHVREINRGDWMQTYTGRKFYPLDPRPEDVDPRDIAHALSLICRFGGHSKRFYSVAEHSVLMSQTFGTHDLALWALLHDAAEAYVGDMVRPLKHCGYLGVYRDVENAIMHAVATRFGLARVGCERNPFDLVGRLEAPAEVKRADERILATERALLMPSVHPWTVDELEPLNVDIQCVGPEFAESMFLSELRDLGVTV